MLYFLLGVLVGWVVEWLLYQFWWKPNHPVSSSAKPADFTNERKQLTEKVSDRDAEISHLKARIAILEERGPAAKTVKSSAPAKKKPAEPNPNPRPNPRPNPARQMTSRKSVV